MFSGPIVKSFTIVVLITLIQATRAYYIKMEPDNQYYDDIRTILKRQQMNIPPSSNTPQIQGPTGDKTPIQKLCQYFRRSECGNMTKRLSKGDEVVFDWPSILRLLENNNKLKIAYESN